MNFAVIDTETTWSDQVMSIGVVIARFGDFEIQDSQYFLLDPEYRYGGMYSDVLFLPGAPQHIVSDRGEILCGIQRWLRDFDVMSIMAYNAKFDKGHLPELAHFDWYDIMKLAAYRQHNRAIPASWPCCKTGRLKTNYGVEPMLRLLSGNLFYREKHHGWYDAIDELKIVELLDLPFEAYTAAKI